MEIIYFKLIISLLCVWYNKQVFCTQIMLNKKISLKLSFVILSTLSSYILTTILKQVYMRPRPENIYNLTDYSFPSAHSSLSIAIFISALIVLLPYFKKGITRYFLEFLCLFFPLVIGLSRIFMRVHWVSDVIFGWFIGLLCVAMSYYLVCISYGYRWNDSKQTHNANKNKR